MKLLKLIVFCSLFSVSCEGPLCQDCGHEEVAKYTTFRILNSTDKSIEFKSYNIFSDSVISIIGPSDSLLSGPFLSRNGFLSPHTSFDSVFIYFADSVSGSFAAVNCYQDSTTVLNPCCWDGYDTFLMTEDHKIWRFEITEEIHDYFE